jgi:hypothetical protein
MSMRRNAAHQTEQSQQSPRSIDRGDLHGEQGIDALIHAASRYADEARTAGAGTADVIRRLGEDFAYIRRQDVMRPKTFLRQMAGAPPVRIGTQGFRADLVDDAHPARHYVAFLVMGYWLPHWAAVVVLWLWEAAGFVRYHGAWSWPDIANGRLGIRHGHIVRRYGAVVLPALLASELAEKG